MQRSALWKGRGDRMQIIYELSWLWTLLGIALAAAAVCVAATALIARASQKRLGKKTAVLIGVAAFALAVVVVILLARTAMPL